MKRVASVMAALAALPLGCRRADLPAAAPVSASLLPWFQTASRLIGRMAAGKSSAEVIAGGQRLGVRKGEGHPTVGLRAGRVNEK
jgi:hypothetical protein